MAETKTSLDGQVALVTGAAHRVGASIARCLHQAGMDIDTMIHKGFLVTLKQCDRCILGFGSMDKCYFPVPMGFN